LASPKRTARRVSKTSDNSSDEDYAGVDLISDSEEDEPDVEVAEEQAIIESAEDEDEDEDEDDDDSDSTPRPSVKDDQDNWDDFSVDGAQDVLDDDSHFFEDHMSRMHASDHDIEATVWASKNISSGSPEPRRVRFHFSDSSSTASDNDDMYPDLFMDQDSLAPSFRKRIENDEDEQHPSSEDGSCWDFDGERASARDSDEESESGGSTGSSGYESGCSLYIGVMCSANVVQLILVKLQKRKSRQRVSGRSGTSPLDLFSDASQQILDPRKRLPSIDGSLPEPCEDPGWVLGSTTPVDHSPS
jgi:hypothetical protein